MTRIDNLAQDPQRRTNQRLDRIERGTQLGNASITVGRLRVAGLEAFLLEGTGRVTGTLYVDGQDGQKGRVDVTGDVRAFGGGRVVVSESGDVNQSMQMIHSNGEGRLVAFGIPMRHVAWDSNVYLAENELVASQADASMRLAPDSARLATGDGRVDIAPEQITLDRAGAAIAIRGDEIRVERGDARVTLHGDEVRVERGDSRVVVAASVEVRNAGGAYMLMDGANVRLKQKTGPGLELRDGDAYISDLPTS